MHHFLTNFNIEHITKYWLVTIGCQLLKQVHDFDLSQLTYAMKPAVGKQSSARQVHSTSNDLCQKFIA